MMSREQNLIGSLIILAAMGWGLDFYHVHQLTQARANEMQANGLEDQCKAKLAETPVRVQFNEQPDGDYRLFLYGSNRSLVCEEQNISIIQQGDAVKPLILECQHPPYIREQ